ncbi:MAG TPA: zinc ribbon domain-containing protein [Tepidiformaceae bacterium]|nr:zinc ribbon domain-containing protein [Tepidiformaceae bacterium]
MQPLFDLVVAQLDLLLAIVIAGTAMALALSWILAFAWAIGDIRDRRGHRHWGLSMLPALPVLVLGFAGIPFYLAARPIAEGRTGIALSDVIGVMSRCDCGSLVRDDFRFCPMCQAKLADTCTGCGATVLSTFAACPHCGLSRLEPAAVSRQADPEPRLVSGERVASAARS